MMRRRGSADNAVSKMLKQEVMRGCLKHVDMEGLAALKYAQQKKEGIMV